MGLLKKSILAAFVSTAMLTTTPSVMAKPAGKVANQTQEEVAQSLIDTIDAAELALTAIQSSADKKETMKLLKATKQTAKTIESSVVLADRDRALNRVMKARSAYKKDNIEEAEAYMIEAVERFKKVKDKYHNF
jgi:biopolymer transport protein ExbD